MRSLLFLLRPFCLCLAALLGSAAQVPAQTTVSLAAARDNTLYEPSPGVTATTSNALGTSLLVAKTGINTGFPLLRRAVLHFDVAGSGVIPADAQIESVELVLTLNNSSLLCVGPEPISLHRLTRDWGEGTSIASVPFTIGVGVAATAGDATWLHTFFDGQLWSVPGGDFTSSVSAAAAIGCCPPQPPPPAPIPPCEIPHSWTSETMRLEVVDWLANPAGNFGWLIRANEALSNSGRAFDSREGASPPVLRVTFTGGAVDSDLDGILDDGDGNGNVGSVPCSCQLFDSPSCKLDCDDNCILEPNDTQLDRGALLAAPPDGIGDACQCGDIDSSGVIDEADVLLFRTSLLDPNDPLPAAGLAKCTLIGAAGACDILDIAVLRRAVEGPQSPAGLAPGIAQVCAATEP